MASMGTMGHYSVYVALLQTSIEGPGFTDEPDASSPISISRFALLQSTSFLFTLTSTSKLSQMALQISEADYQWYQKFHSLRQNIASAIKVISMRGKKALNEDEIDEDEQDFEVYYGRRNHFK